MPTDVIVGPFGGYIILFSTLFCRPIRREGMPTRCIVGPFGGYNVLFFVVLFWWGVRRLKSPIPPHSSVGPSGGKTCMFHQMHCRPIWRMHRFLLWPSHRNQKRRHRARTPSARVIHLSTVIPSIQDSTKDQAGQGQGDRPHIQAKDPMWSLAARSVEQ
ncbi:hypothetical protein EDD21DRAFT_428989 [Dissophora ornata]|nr:hypothetical protein EDD21DRAFT_428989 [Dissophora ornata]